MPFVAEAFLSLDVSPEVAFDTLADHPSWKDWMPRSFAPISKADGPLRAGTKIKMRVAGAPATIEVTIVERAKEIQWCGGVRGLLRAEHSFHFESDGKGGTKVHSHEIWRGALAPLLRIFVKPRAEKIGSEQLAGLASAVKR
jgi:hypothetical protein